MFAISIAGLSIDSYSTIFTFTNVSKCMYSSQRQLYCKASVYNIEEAKKKDHVHYSVKVPIEPGLVSRASQSQAAMRQQHLDKEDWLLQTQSLSNQPYSWYLSKKLLFVGQTAYSARHQSYPEPSLCSLIRQYRERKHTSFGISRLKTYFRRDEILRRMVKLKSEEISTIELKKP